MAPPMKLQVLVALEALVADLTHEAVGGEQRLRGEGDNLRVRIWRKRKELVVARS